jgi:dihydrofolate reductase
MATVVANMSMSLDGFVADPDDGVDELFGWYFSGPVEVRTHVDWLTFGMHEPSAGHLRESFARCGAILTGRHLFDVAGGWRGAHPAGAPVVVVTHEVPHGWPREDAPFTFVTEGVEAAVAAAKEIAGDKVVAVASANVTQQCLDAGLVDELWVDLVPVLLGKGVRFFDRLATAPIRLETPAVLEGTGVTHLTYTVLR